MDYQQKHRLYQQARARREQALDIYEGGLRIEKKEGYLTRHPFETDKQYQIRLERATYRNFAAPIVDVFSSFICDGRPARTLPQALEEMQPDVDRCQVSADVFFGNVVRMAAAAGTRFVLVDMEKAAGVTLAESMAVGRRELPYFVEVDADDLYDWHLDDRGLAWAVIHSHENVTATPFAEPLVQEVLTVWTRQEWRRLVSTPFAVSQATSSMEFSEESTGTHSLGEVPLVPFLFEPVTPMTGNAATDDVMTLVLRVYRRDSELDKMLFDCAVPLGIINGIDPEQKDDFVRASSNMLFSSSPDGIQASYLEPVGTSYTALRESLTSDIASIREIALRMVKPYSGVGESAEAKTLDKQQLDTQLANFARRSGTAERKCWELAYKWLNNGREPNPDEIVTEYNLDYQVQDAERLDRQYLLEMLRNGAISKQTYLELLQKLGALDEAFDVSGEIQKLDLEGKGEEGPASSYKSLFDQVS